MEQFRIEVANQGKGYFFNITKIGDQQFEIFNEASERVGTIKIDDQDHEHCETLDCQIDLPLLNAIREGILLHYKLIKQ